MAKPHFDIDAKNAYDADARYAKVVVNTEDSPSENDTFFQDVKGYIIIEDNGVGMDEEAIKTGWLTISKSPKRELKASKRTTAAGRTPLGDKGLGRLGAQRLGDNIEIFTVQKAEMSLTVLVGRGMIFVEEKR